MFNLDEIIRGKGRGNCYISEVTVFELRFGAENSQDPKKSHKAVDKFLQGLAIIPIYGSERTYAEEKVRLRKKGTPMHDEFDLLIGITAIENQLILVTDNLKDFKYLQDLEVVNWCMR
jgi:tRNA(fMet)-specific endonuclease VapC